MYIVTYESKRDKSLVYVYYKYKGEIMGKFYKNTMKYFSKYPDQNAFVSLLAGLGIGFLLAYPVVGEHPIRWGGLFVLMAVVGYAWAGFQKVK
jgi:hypothetical protein